MGEMYEINTVMSWLEGLAQDDWADFHSDSEVRNIAKAALELLEKKEPVKCKNCKFYPDGDGATSWLPCREIITPPNWFCAYGKRRDEN